MEKFPPRIICTRTSGQDLRAELEDVVRVELSSELTGQETTKEAEELAREIIDDELDCNVAEEEEDEGY
jgi:hypothetical protein